MNDESKSLKSLPDGVDEIIRQVQKDSSVRALLSDKKIFDDFTTLLSDLNKLVTEKKDTEQKFSQISLF